MALLALLGGCGLEINNTDGAECSGSALEVSASAEAVSTSAYRWSIDESASLKQVQLRRGQTLAVPYTVTVSPGDEPSDRGLSVRGSIEVDNKTGCEATLTGVGGQVRDEGVIDLDVRCGQDFPFSLAAGVGLECLYNAPVPDSSFNSVKACAGTSGEVTGGCGTSSVDFSNLTTEVVDTCASVTDDRHGDLGFSCVNGDQPKSFTFNQDIGPFDSCGLHEVENTACFSTFDENPSPFATPATGCDSWTITVDVPC